MTGPHFEERGTWGICGRGTTNGSCVCHTYRLPSLDEPEVGECCPRCAEPLRLVGYCGACGWRRSE